jgi:hypothetical protein
MPVGGIRYGAPNCLATQYFCGSNLRSSNANASGLPAYAIQQQLFSRQHCHNPFGRYFPSHGIG